MSRPHNPGIWILDRREMRRTSLLGFAKVQHPGGAVVTADAADDRLVEDNPVTDEVGDGGAALQPGEHDGAAVADHLRRLHHRGGQRMVRRQG